LCHQNVAKQVLQVIKQQNRQAFESIISEITQSINRSLQTAKPAKTKTNCVTGCSVVTNAQKEENTNH